VAWTSGQTQGFRYGKPSVNYEPQYDWNWPRIARREARRLGMPEDTVSTGMMPGPQLSVRGPTGELGRYYDQARAEDMQRFHQTWDPSNNRQAVDIFRMPDSQVPYHSFNWHTEDPAGFLDEHGLPYFAHGGLV
jgi:hypothetical protein